MYWSTVPWGIPCNGRCSLGRDGQCWPIPQLPSVPPPTGLHLHFVSMPTPANICFSSPSLFPPRPLVIRHSFYPLHSSLPSSNPSKPPSSFLDTRKEGKDYHHPLSPNSFLGIVDIPPDAKAPGTRPLQPCNSYSDSHSNRTGSGADHLETWDLKKKSC